MWQEYKDVSVWYGISGYIVATGTGFFRIYNNKHWLTDVAAGAGIGILIDKQYGFEIQFCIDEELADKEFNLIYDDEPDGDDEDVPIENIPTELTFA